MTPSTWPRWPPGSSRWPAAPKGTGDDQCRRLYLGNGGAVRQTIIEMESGFLLVAAAGSGTCLAVIAGPDADLGLVAYEMAILVRRTGEHIRVNRRASALSGWG